MYQREIVHQVHDSLIKEIYDLQAECVTLKTKVAELTSHNSSIIQLLSDCQDVICNSVFLDEKGHSAFMDRINTVLAQ